MKRILESLRNTDQSAGSYLWRAWLIALVPSLVISAAVTLLLPDSSPPLKGPPVVLLAGVLFLSPWLETLMMWPVLRLLKWWIRSPVWVAAASAVFWGVLHSLAAPVWGLGVAWPFFVFSMCFLEWERRSTGRAIVMTALVHTCQNALPAAALVLAS